MKLCKINSLYIVLICALVMTATGCKKWLVDQDNDPSNLAPDDFYTLPEHADAAIAAAYDRTRFFAGGAGIFANNFSMLEMPTGTARTETGQNTDLNNLLGLSYNGDNVFVLNWWTSLYQVIAQTNLVLDKVPAIKMDDAPKKRVLGEAQFLRAWSYFYLVRLYGDVPLLTTSILKVQDPMTYAGRTPKDSVYMQIVADLKDAEASGLKWTDASGRASLGAVKSLLAEVYLTMAGYPLNKGKTYYELARDKAGQVIDSGKFALFTDYNYLHDESKENTGEQIFEIQFLAGVADNGNQANLLPNFKEVSAYGTEVGSTTPSPSFVNSFEPGDKRTVDRQGFFYTSYYDKGFGTLKPLGAPYIYKHFDIAANGTQGKEGTAKSGLNWMNIRYAQVLLTYAEAQNEADGTPNQKAHDALKAIRDRAGLVTGALSDYTSFKDAVLKERWHELCYEGVTWFDMVRLKMAYNDATKTLEPFEGHKFPDGVTTLTKKHLLFPLPTVEMQNNPKLRPQNDGYPGVD